MKLCTVIVLFTRMLFFIVIPQVESFTCGSLNTYQLTRSQIEFIFYGRKCMRLFRKIYHNDDGSMDIKSAPKLDYNENYYKVLEIDSTSTHAEIKKSFLKMIFKYHPDRVGIHPDDHSGDELKALRDQQTMVINAAYKTLKDETLRFEYDKKHREPIRIGSSELGGFKLSEEELERRRLAKLAAEEEKQIKKKEQQRKIAMEKNAAVEKAKQKKKN